MYTRRQQIVEGALMLVGLPVVVALGLIWHGVRLGYYLLWRRWRQTDPRVRYYNDLYYFYAYGSPVRPHGPVG